MRLEAQPRDEPGKIEPVALQIERSLQARHMRYVPHKKAMLRRTLTGPGSLLKLRSWRVQAAALTLHLLPTPEVSACNGEIG